MRLVNRLIEQLYACAFDQTPEVPTQKAYIVPPSPTSSSSRPPRPHALSRHATAVAAHASQAAGSPVPRFQPRYSSLRRLSYASFSSRIASSAASRSAALPVWPNAAKSAAGSRLCAGANASLRNPKCWAAPPECRGQPQAFGCCREVTAVDSYGATDTAILTMPCCRPAPRRPGAGRGRGCGKPGAGSALRALPRRSPQSQGAPAR